MKFKYTSDKDQFKEFKEEVRRLIIEEVNNKCFSQTQLANILNTSQPRVSNLINSDDLTLFSLEYLLNCLTILRPGSVSINIKPLKVR